MKAVWWKARGNRGNASRGISEDASGSLKTGWTILHEMKESREWWHWGRRAHGVMHDFLCTVLGSALIDGGKLLLMTTFAV